MASSHVILMHIFKNEMTLVKLLLEHWADVRAKDSIGLQPIHFVGLQKFKLVSLLLDHGADVNAEDHNGKTILDYYLNSPLETRDFRFLLKRGARLRFSENLKRHPEMLHVWSRRKWLMVKCAVKFLSLHQRAVVTANHPLRKKARGEFNEC